MFFLSLIFCGSGGGGGLWILIRWLPDQLVSLKPADQDTVFCLCLCVHANSWSLVGRLIRSRSRVGCLQMSGMIKVDIF